MRGLKPSREPMRQTSMCRRVKMLSLHQQLRRLNHSKPQTSNCSISSYRSQLGSTIRPQGSSQACSRSLLDIFQSQTRACNLKRLATHRIRSRQATMDHVHQCLQCRRALPTTCLLNRQEEPLSKHSQQAYLVSGALLMHLQPVCPTFKLFNNS